MLSISNAVLQAKSASETFCLNVSVRGAIDNGLLDLLEGKLAVLPFQMKIKEESMASRLVLQSLTDQILPQMAQHLTMVTLVMPILFMLFEKGQRNSHWI